MQLVQVETLAFVRARTGTAIVSDLRPGLNEDEYVVCQIAREDVSDHQGP